MRNLLPLILILIMSGFVIFGYPQWVEKPEKDGPGPLSVRIAAEYAAPEYHNPLDYWMTHHTDAVNRGDLAQNDCLYCHVPEESCNNCHNYVGANPIVETLP